MVRTGAIEYLYPTRATPSSSSPRPTASRSASSGPSKSSKEQIIHGRIYRTVAELRAAVEAFVELYNRQWLPEKNGYLSPSATREAWYAREAQGVAA